MSTQITPFTAASVPAFVKTAQGNLGEVTFGAGYKVVSIKGKVFTLKDGDEKTLIVKPGTDEPAASLEVVILDVGPSLDLRHNERVFYLKEYEEGSVAKPDCYSDDGITPGADAVAPQAKSCAVCPHNAKGSGKTGVGKACASSKRLALATPDNLGEPMLLRIPGASLKPFNDYLKWMKDSNIADTAHVVTKIGFDYTVAHPALTFKALGWAPSDPTEAKATDEVAYITGKKKVAAAPAAEAPKVFAEEAPGFVKGPAAAKEEASKAKPAPKPTPKVEDDLPTEPKQPTNVRVEGEAKPTEPKVTEIEGSLDDVLSDVDLDFDD